MIVREVVTLGGNANECPVGPKRRKTEKEWEVSEREEDRQIET